MRILGHKHINKIAQTHSKLHDEELLTGSSCPTVALALPSSSSSEYSSRRDVLAADTGLLAEIFVELDIFADILDDLLGVTTTSSSSSSGLLSIGFSVIPETKPAN